MSKSIQNNKDPVNTRRRLLEATETLLASHGYFGVSEPRVCELSGVTRGGLRHHFPTGKYGLVTALAENLIQSLPEKGNNQGKLRVAQLLEFLGNNPINNPLTRLLDLWLASRMDQELHEAIQPAVSAYFRGLFCVESSNDIPSELLPFSFMLHGAMLYVYGRYHDPAKLQAAISTLYGFIQQEPASFEGSSAYVAAP